MADAVRDIDFLNRVPEPHVHPRDRDILGVSGVWRGSGISRGPSDRKLSSNECGSVLGNSHDESLCFAPASMADRCGESIAHTQGKSA